MMSGIGLSAEPMSQQRWFALEQSGKATESRSPRVYSCCAESQVNADKHSDAAGGEAAPRGRPCN
jgi:hypothetical protein